MIIVNPGGGGGGGGGLRHQAAAVVYKNRGVRRVAILQALGAAVPCRIRGGGRVQ